MYQYRIVGLWAALAVVPGCMDTTETAPGGGRIAIEVAPLSLASVTDASYTLRVTNAADGGGDVVWERTALTSTQYGDGGGSLSYVGPCDADTGTNSVTLTLDALYEGSGVLISETTYNNPGALTRNIACVENTDVAVDFSVTIARDAQQGFFDVAVSFEDVFCSAKLDCVKSGTANDDLELLHNPATDARDMTAVLGFACTASTTVGATTYLYMDDPSIHCDGAAPFDTADVTFDISAPGNVDLTADTSINPGGYLFDAAVYYGNEQLLSKAYWNVAFGLNEDVFALASTGRCVLTARATASSTPLTESPEGFALPEGEVYPVVEWSVPLTDAGRVCTTHEVNGGNGVATDYLGYLAAPNLFTWNPDPIYLRHEYSSATGEVLTATGDPCADPSAFASCQDILAAGCSTGDGEYLIDPDGAGAVYAPFSVFCDMTTDDGGWTLVAALGPYGYGTVDYGGQVIAGASAIKPLSRTVPANNTVYKFADTTINAIKDTAATAPGIRYETTAGNKYGRGDCVWASVTALAPDNTACLDFVLSYASAPTWVHGYTSNQIGGCSGSGLGVSGPGSTCVAGTGNMAFCLLNCNSRTDNHFHRHWCGDGPSGYLWVR